MASNLVGTVVTKMRSAVVFLWGLLSKDVRKSQQQSRVLFDYASDGIWESDLNGKILRVNAAGLSMLGYCEEEVIGRTFDIFVAKSNRARLYERVKRLRNPGAVDISEWQLISKDGSIVEVEISAKIYGRSAIYGFVRDITIRKCFERRLAFLASLSAQLSEVMSYDERVRISADVMTPRYADLCVVSMVENDEVHFRAVSTANEKTRMRFQAPNVQLDLRVPNRFSPYEVIRTRKPIIVLDVQAEVFPDSDVSASFKSYLEELGVTSYISIPLISRDRVVGLFNLAMQSRSRRFHQKDIGFFEEVADRCAVAIDNADLYQRAQAAAHARELVLSIVSHDIRNPMANIDLAVQLLQSSAQSASEESLHLAPELVEKTVSRIKSSLQAMERLIADLLDFGKIQSGTLSVKMESVEVAALVKTAIEPFEEKCRRKNLKLLTEIDEAVSRVRCDPTRLVQVLWNLIGNSLKFTPAGGEIRLSTKADAEDRVHFTVADTGCGVNNAELSKIFERFWQSKEAAEIGYGLGLSIAKGIVVSHGGKIWAESSEGHGTEIHFVVPVDHSQPNQPSIQSSPIVQPRPDKDLLKSLSGVRILAVDDAPENLVLLKMFLERAGADFFYSETVRDALGVLNEIHPDVILTDIELGRESGFDLLRRLRAWESNLGKPRTPVIALSAHVDDESRKKIQMAGFDLEFQKPFVPAVLVDAMARLTLQQALSENQTLEAGV
ncbi:MAG: ATP-binding protein [Bdellovibrionales bacterium]|nr:ATP-binding protein [Bdellovibrionales bacterium]